MPRINFVVGPNEVSNEEFGALLQSFRESANLSRSIAADHFGVSSEYVRLIERGKRIPAFGRMHDILNAYEVKHTIEDDLLIIDDGVDTFAITFTSRIREARDSERSVTQNPNRTELIGHIVELLVKADDRALRTVHEVLNVSRGKHLL